MPVAVLGQRQWPDPLPTACRRRDGASCCGWVWPWRTLPRWSLGFPGDPPFPRVPCRALSWPCGGCGERGPESQAPACCPPRTSPMARPSASVPSGRDSERPSCFPVSQGIPGVFACPWATLGRPEAFFSQPWDCSSGCEGVRSGCEGRSSLDVRDLVVASGWVVLEPSPSAHLLPLWVTRSLELSLGFFGPGAGDGSTSTGQLSGGVVVVVTQFPFLLTGLAVRRVSQASECSAHLRLPLPGAGRQETCGSADCSSLRVARTTVSEVAREGRGMRGDDEAPRCSVAFPPDCPAAPHSPASRDSYSRRVWGGGVSVESSGLGGKP